jgi:hypothetical protein
MPPSLYLKTAPEGGSRPPPYLVPRRVRLGWVRYGGPPGGSRRPDPSPNASKQHLGGPDPPLVSTMWPSEPPRRPKAIRGTPYFVSVSLWWLLHYRSSRYVVRLCVVRSSSQVVSSQYNPQTTDQESRTVRRRRTNTRTKGTTKYK